MKIRTLPEAITELHKVDSLCALKLPTLRGMAKRGEIPLIVVGKRRLVDVDLLVTTLSTPSHKNEPAPAADYGNIRQISG